MYLIEGDRNGGKKSVDAKWRGEEEAFLINIFPRPPPRWCVLCVFRKGLKRKRERERERGKER